MYGLTYMNLNIDIVTLYVDMIEKYINFDIYYLTMP